MRPGGIKYHIKITISSNTLQLIVKSRSKIPTKENKFEACVFQLKCTHVFQLKHEVSELDISTTDKAHVCHQSEHSDQHMGSQDIMHFVLWPV